MNKQFRIKFVRKFGKDYDRVVRELRKDAGWAHPFFYGSAQFLQIAEGLKKAVEAQDVLDKLGEPYVVTPDFLRQTGRNVPDFKQWARTPGFVEEWYEDWDEERRAAIYKGKSIRKRLRQRRKRIAIIEQRKAEAIRPPCPKCGRIVDSFNGAQVHILACGWRPK
jgi:hypothetical protein